MEGFFQPNVELQVRRGNLPHWRQNEVLYFVTFRLADSLPDEKLEAWQAERDIWLSRHPRPHSLEDERQYQERFSRQLERWLDASHGECLLHDVASASLVEEALRHFDGERYNLGKHVVAANHVHALWSCPMRGTRYRIFFTVGNPTRA